MFRSPGLRFIAVGILALVMFIPLGLVSDIVQDRARLSEETIRSVSSEWGGAQTLSGPVLIIPVTEDVTYDRRREAVDALTGLTLRDEKGNAIYEHFQETVTETRPAVHLFAEALDIDIATRSDLRRRGIFEVPVYTAEAALGFDFDPSAATGVLTGEEVPHWDEARVELTLSSNRALRGEALLTTGGRALTLEPAGGREGGVSARTGDPRDLGRYELSLTLNGAGHLAAAATGRTTRLTLSGDWPDPGFFGDFLPGAREVSDAGFTASWTVPHLARALPQVSRENLDGLARKSATMGVRYVTPNDFYQKAWRASRYGILFIGLTFLTILLLDRASERPAHPVQYLMVGLAQAVFILLMVAYAEQFGFGAAYLMAAGATVGLLTVFGATALRLGRRTWVLTAMLSTVYGVLYLILKSADYALLAGSTLAFLALAGTMLLTRNEDWHGPVRTGGFRLFRRRAAPEAAA